MYVYVCRIPSQELSITENRIGTIRCIFRTPQIKIVQPDNFVDGARFTGESRVIQFVEYQYRAFYQARKKFFEHSLGRRIKIEIEASHGDYCLRIVLQPFRPCQAGVAFDQFEFSNMCVRRDAFIHRKDLLKDFFIAVHRFVIADAHHIAIFVAYGWKDGKSIESDDGSADIEWFINGALIAQGS